MKKTFKKIAVLLLVVLIAMQFYRPEKNISNGYTTLFFETETQPPTPVLETLQTSCYDCHSNNTTYPWYHQIAPVSYWINDHIADGKKHLNFSDWERYSAKKKDHKMEELIEEVLEREMPLPSYTWTHGNITEAQVQALVTWAKQSRVIYELKANGTPK